MIQFMRKYAALVALAVVLALTAVPPALKALAASSQGNFTVLHNVAEMGAVVTNTSAVAATYTSADASGSFSSVSCTFTQTAHSGSPSTTFSIMGKDITTGQYYTLVTSGAITADNTPTSIAAGAGVATTSNVGVGFPVPSKFQVSEVVAGSSTPIVTGKVTCRLHT